MTSPPDPLIGTFINNRYEILSVIGRGGMSIVYKAKNPEMGRDVAIKMLKAEFMTDNEMVARFSRETAAARRLAHRNLVTVHDTGIDEHGNPYLIMDHLEGMPLSDTIEKEGRLPVKRCLKIFVQICNGLAHMHTHNIIHRDIKPGNIMLLQTATTEDYVKIFDFGFVKILPYGNARYQKLTQSGDVLGTPLYMSPEQSLGRELDTRSDIYSFGCVMYECLTGQAPLVGINVAATMQKQIKEIPKSLDVARPDLYIPEQLTEIIFKTLEKEPNDRYQSIVDVKRDLEAISEALLKKKSTQVTKLPALSKLKQKKKNKQKFSPIPTIVLSTLLLAVFGLAAFLILNPNNRPTSIYQLQLSIEIDKHRKVGLTAFQKGDYKQAQIQLQTALNTATKAKMPDKETLLYQDMARLCLVENKLQEASTYAHKALNLQKTFINNTTSLSTAHTLETLALIAMANNNDKEAVNNWQKILAIEENNESISKQELANTYLSLAYLYEITDQFVKADEFYKKAIFALESEPKIESTLHSHALHQYAHFLHRMNKNVEARKWEIKAKALRSIH
jgi:serine/threonine protein kinase